MSMRLWEYSGVDESCHAQHDMEERRNREPADLHVSAVRTSGVEVAVAVPTSLAISMELHHVRNHGRPWQVWGEVPYARCQGAIQIWSTIHTVSCDIIVSVGESHPDSVDLDLLRWLARGGVGGRYSCTV